MALDNLDAPLRMTWTLDDRLDAGSQLQLADKVADSGLFFLTLAGHPLASPVLPEMLERLANRGIELSLVIRSADLPETLPSGWPVARLMLTVEPATEKPTLQAELLRQQVAAIREAGYAVGLQMLPLRYSLPLLPQLLALAVELDIEHVNLPNVPVADLDPGELGPCLLRAGDLNAFAAHWGESAPPLLPAGLIVHDLFLWEILCPGRDRDHYSGCQAGNSLAHVDANGTLYPCSSWNQPLGSLFDTSVADFWQQSIRTAIREEIARQPDGCADCPTYARCLAGCRGLSRDFPSPASEHRGQDLMCPDLL